MPSSRAIAAFVSSVALVAVFGPLTTRVLGQSIAPAVADLASGDRDRVVTGRGTLLSQLNAVRSNPPALATFATDIGTGLLPVASGNDPHAKLNVAIVAQRVAEQSGAVSLADLCAKLDADSSPAVAAYGLRASSFILPRMLVNGPADNLVNAVVGSVAAHPESEAVASEAYFAVLRVLTDRTAAETLTPAGVTSATPRAVDVVHKLLEARVTQFGTGTLAEPAAEQPAISFLGRQNTWNLSLPPQRTATIRLLLSLMQGAANEMAQVPNNPTARLRLEALRNVVKSTAGSLSVICDPKVANKPALLPNVQKLAGFGLATPVSEYKQLIGQVVSDFAKEWPDATPASQPATQSAGK